MEKSERSIKAFIIPYEAWYKNVISGNPRIYIGLYYEAGGMMENLGLSGTGSVSGLWHIVMHGKH